MKILEKTALILFSITILIISVTTCLVIFDLVELENIFEFLEETIEKEIATRIILGVCIVFILLAIKALFFPSKIKKQPELKSGVLLENKDGRLLISKDTIENLVNGVVKSFKDALEVQTKINLNELNEITVYVSLLVKEDAIIKELSYNIQNKIKETVKRSTDLEVKQVNINIKNVENSKNAEKSNKAIKKENIDNNKLNENNINKNENINKEDSNKEEVSISK